MNNFVIKKINFSFGTRSVVRKEITLLVEDVNSIRFNMETEARYEYTSEENNKKIITVQKKVFLRNLEIIIFEDSFLKKDVENLLKYIHVDDTPIITFYDDKDNQTIISYNKLTLLLSK